MIKRISTLFLCSFLSVFSVNAQPDEDTKINDSNLYETEKDNDNSTAVKNYDVLKHSESKTQIEDVDRALASDSILEILSENESNLKNSADSVESNSVERDQLLLDKAKARHKKALQANKNPEQLDEDLVKLRQEANAEYHRNEGNEKIAKTNAFKVAKESVGRSDDNEHEKSLSSYFSKISNGDKDKKDKDKNSENGKKTYQKKTDALMNAFK